MINELYHYGTKRHSGRYPYGSGDEPFQHESDFLKNVNILREQGMSDTEIAKSLGMSTTEFRQRNNIEKADLKSAEYSYALRMKERGFSNVAIADKLGRNESYVRTLLKPATEAKAHKQEVTVDILKQAVENSKYIDVGEGTQCQLKITKTNLDNSLRRLQDEGYAIRYLKVPQVGVPGNYTWVKVLTKEDVPWKELKEHAYEIGSPADGLNQNAIGNTIDLDTKITSLGLREPVSIDSNRIYIRYTEDGGSDKDGVIELRRNVPDLSLGNANYAQVRIAVNDTHYLKGMALYSDNVPEGYDIVFNTNKHVGTPAMGSKDNTVFKNLKSDPDNPFGTTLRMKDGKIVGQSEYIDINGEKKLSPINIVRQEGDWNQWSNTLASQFLSKQPKELAKQQLNKSLKDKQEEFDELKTLNNPEIKKKLLISFADDCDASASHLKAAALPRQSAKVILPLDNIADDEVYAPSYREGEQVVLIRYPHGGTFELPVLTVTHKNQQGIDILGKTPADAIGINKHVADRLSGADFDGDTVVVIPVEGQKIKSTSALAGLEGFDTKEAYGPRTYEGIDIVKMTKRNTQTEMGKISNLITDMTIKGAKEDELTRAVRHSMVVIDAEKHSLNYKQSEKDNRIAELKEKYQGRSNGGASTLISKASSEQHISIRTEKRPSIRTEEEQEWLNKANSGSIDISSKDNQREYNRILLKMTDDEYKDYKNGKKIYATTPEYYDVKNKKTGEWVSKERTMTTSKMSLVDDARALSSGTVMEGLYADYANKLKAMANEARKEAIDIQPTKVNKSAKETYAAEVSSLNAKLNESLKNKPLERKAQIIANAIIDAKKTDEMDNDDFKKLRNQALAAARNKVGSSKKNRSIDITEKEWEAIVSGAVSSTQISKILDNTDADLIKQYATPRSNNSVTPAKLARIESLKDSGKTLSEIADATGISASTISKILTEED